MEYLPIDPNELEAKNKEKTEKKLKEFREYIVEKGVVLAFVKVLLSLKYADKKPKNPIKAIRDFFGKYRDPRWDEMDALKEKIIVYFLISLNFFVYLCSRIIVLLWNYSNNDLISS